MIEQISKIVRENCRLGDDVEVLSPTTNLYDVGMTSHATVNVMLALEEQFEIEFPEHMLKRSVFESIAAMRDAIQRLLVAA